MSGLRLCQSCHSNTHLRHASLNPVFACRCSCGPLQWTSSSSDAVHGNATTEQHGPATAAVFDCPRQPQGMQPQGLQHGDMMMQQHTHVQDHMNNALSLDAFSHDLLDDAFPSFPSPAVETQSSSSQQQADSGGSPGKRVKSETQSQAISSGSAPLTKNPSLQRNLRKLSVRGRAKPTGQQPPQSSPDDLFTAAMQNAQMQMSMAMPVVGPGSWLSPSTLDTSQDGVRRPPAA